MSARLCDRHHCGWRMLICLQLTKDQQESPRPASSQAIGSSSFKLYQDLIAGADIGKWALLVRGDPIGDCGGPQMMSNPLILRGSQIALKRQQTRVTLDCQLDEQPFVALSAEALQYAEATSKRSREAPLLQQRVRRSLPSDELLARLKARMQMAAKSYSPGTVPRARVARPAEAVPAGLLRSGSAPARRLGSSSSVKLRRGPAKPGRGITAVPELHTLPQAVSSAADARVVPLPDMRSSADSSSTAGKQSQCAVQHSARGRSGQPCKPTQTPQGRTNKCNMPKTSHSGLQAGASSSVDKLAASLISLKASPDLVQAFLRTQSGKLMEHVSLFRYILYLSKPLHGCLQIQKPTVRPLRRSSHFRWLGSA